MIKIAICDDEEIYIKFIVKILEEYFMKNDTYDYQVDTFLNGEEVKNTDVDYNIYLLDIEMPCVSGIDLKEYIENRGNGGNIVFVSNHDHHMIKLFGKNVHAYIPKQELKHELPATLSKIIKKYIDSEIVYIVGDYIGVNDIIYISVNKGYCTLHTRKKKYIYSINLVKLLEFIGSKKIMKTHRSYAINLNYVEGMDNGNVLLSTGDAISISKKFIKDFKYRYQCNMFLYM